MKLVADTPELKPKAITESKSGSRPESTPESKDGVEHELKDDLKSVAMPELQKKLDSSPNGLIKLRRRSG